jgi:ribonuclease HII
MGMKMKSFLLASCGLVLITVPAAAQNDDIYMDGTHGDFALASAAQAVQEDATADRDYARERAAVGGSIAPADTIVVIGSGLDATPGTPAYSIVEIDREKLVTTASDRLEDALASVAGFQQFRRSDSRSSNPTAQGVTLRALGGNASSRALVLVDGVLPLRGWLGPQRTLVRGDSRCAAIAAASILAKQERDGLMRRLALRFPGYGLERHAGYGTLAHRQAIARLGASGLHRFSFLGARRTSS